MWWGRCGGGWCGGIVDSVNRSGVGGRGCGGGGGSVTPNVVNAVNGPGGAVIEKDGERVGGVKSLDSAGVVFVVAGEPKLDEVAYGGERLLGHCGECGGQLQIAGGRGGVVGWDVLFERIEMGNGRGGRNSRFTWDFKQRARMSVGSEGAKSLRVERQYSTNLIFSFLNRPAIAFPPSPILSRFLPYFRANPTSL